MMSEVYENILSHSASESKNIVLNVRRFNQPFTQNTTSLNYKGAR